MSMLTALQEGSNRNVRDHYSGIHKSRWVNKLGPFMQIPFLWILALIHTLTSLFVKR